MVKLQSLSLTNFMTIEQLDMQFDDKTVIMIGGQNGGGKSALLHAIALALYEYKKGDSYKDYVRVGASAATVYLRALYNGLPISYELKISTSKYGVPLTRTIRYNDKIYNNSECKLLLDELESEYLEHAMFLLQNDSSIVDLRPSERARLLKKMLHFEFDEQVAALKTRLDSEQQTFAELSIRLDEAQKQRFSLLQLLDESQKEEVPRIKRRLQYIDRQLGALDTFDPAVVMRVSTELRNEEASTQQKEATVTSSQRILQQKKQRLAQLEATQIPIPAAIDDDVEEYYEGQLSSASSLVAMTEYSVQTASNLVKQLQGQLAISQTGVCHSCGHTIEQKHVDKLQQGLDDATAELTQLTEYLLQLKQNEIAARREVDSVMASSKAYRVATQQEEARQREAAALREAILAAEESLALHEAAVQSARKRVSELRQQNTDLQKVREVAERKGQLEAEKAQLELQLSTINNAVVINKERRKRNEEIEEARLEHTELLKKLAHTVNQTAQSIDVLKRSITIFETEFPNFIILRTCAHLEDYINGFIQKLFPYMSVRLRPSRSGVEFYYTAESSEEEWLSVKMASGAQAAVLTLAWRVAIAKLYGVTTILLDEVDSAATEENAAIIYQFIASLDTFDQIIFISHKKEAMKSISSLMDNVICYYVQGGEYSIVDDVANL